MELMRPAYIVYVSPIRETFLLAVCMEPRFSGEKYRRAANCTRARLPIRAPIRSVIYYHLAFFSPFLSRRLPTLRPRPRLFFFFFAIFPAWNLRLAPLCQVN
jgi:hypothetical protein